MSTIQQLYQQAELAEAAYSNFFDKNGHLLTNRDRIKDALTLGDGKMSVSQADAFLDNYRLIHQLPDTGNGFSATVFESGAHYVLAIRGSTPDQAALDFLEDGALIVNTGVALDQAVDLYNYWKSLNTPEGTTYQAAILAPVENYPNETFHEDQLFFNAVTGTFRTLKFVPSSTLTEPRAMGVRLNFVCEIEPPDPFISATSKTSPTPTTVQTIPKPCQCHQVVAVDRARVSCHVQARWRESRSRGVQAYQTSAQGSCVLAQPSGSLVDTGAAVAAGLRRSARSRLVSRCGV